MLTSSTVGDLRPPRWLLEDGPEGDVVLSTRCRLARNLEELPFPWRAPERQRRELAQAALSAVDGSSLLERSARIPRDGLAEKDLLRLVEMRLASSHWWEAGSLRWLIAAADGVTSLLVNEEDHLRIQAILPGL